LTVGLLLCRYYVRVSRCTRFGTALNLLLLITALFTSLTGMIVGERATARMETSASAIAEGMTCAAAEEIGTVLPIRAACSVPGLQRTFSTLHEFVLPARGRLTPDKQNE
jgi:hypothetical protein